MSHTLEQLEAMPARELDFLLADIFYEHDRKCREARDGFICYRRSTDDGGVGYEPIKEIPAYSTTWEGMAEALGHLRGFGWGADLWHPAEDTEDCAATVSMRSIGGDYSHPVEARANELPRALALAIAMAFRGAKRR